jgi:hypothetical protein
MKLVIFSATHWQSFMGLVRSEIFGAEVSILRIFWPKMAVWSANHISAMDLI